MKPPRTRFAPSPTGALHAGTVRTALFAWLVARHGNGKFILRIEDTDQAREVEGAVQNIMDSLKYVGLDWDEGPDTDNSYGPYFQSKRLDSYKEWAQKLADQGKAYADPYSTEELEELRNKAKAEHRPFLYREHRPENPPVWDGSQPLRLKSDPKEYKWTDAVMGELSAGPEAIDDFILMKSDGFPTYNFAHIIDDHLMEITHVIRSQEFTSSVPRYLNLYEALEIEPPILGTVPQVLASSGNRKLSKREGAKQMLDYKRQGILPEAMFSFLASLGWNDGSEQEIYTKPELIEKFTLDRVQKSGAHFDEQKLLWISGHFVRALSVDELFELTQGYLPKEANNYDDEYKKRVLGLVKERLKYFGELPELTNFFFSDLPVNPSLIEGNSKLSKIDKPTLADYLNQTKASLAESDFSEADIQERLNKLLETNQQTPAVLFNLIRVATTQASASPGLPGTLAALGKDVSIRRIDQTIASLS